MLPNAPDYYKFVKHLTLKLIFSIKSLTPTELLADPPLRISGAQKIMIPEKDLALFRRTVQNG